MQKNRLLIPAKRKEIENEIVKNNLNLSMFVWEDHKSEELLEKSLSTKNQTVNPFERMELRNSYQIQYENSNQTISKLSYTYNLAFFTFDRIDNKWMSKYSLGKDYGENKKRFNSLEEQIDFAKNNWLADLSQNLQAEGLIEQQQVDMSKNRLTTPANKKQIENKITNIGLNLSDFEWENQKSKELLERYEKRNFGQNAPSSNLGRREKLYKYKNDYENSPQPNISKLVHIETQAFITFDHFVRAKFSEYSLGNDYGEEKKHFRTLDEQIIFAIKWLEELKENLIAFGLVKEDDKLLDNNQAFEKEENSDNLAKANQLFNEVKQEASHIREIPEKEVEEKNILRLIKKAESAIKEFGSEGHEEIVELEHISAKLREELPPESFSEAKARVEKPLLRKGFKWFGKKVMIAIFSIVIIGVLLFWVIRIYRSVGLSSDTTITNTNNTNLIIPNSNQYSQTTTTPKEDESINKRVELYVTENDLAEAFDGEIRISLIGTSLTKTSSGELGYKVTATIQSTGYKPIRIAQKEVDYNVIYEAKNKYEIQIKTAGTGSARFLITKLDSETEKTQQ